MSLYTPRDTHSFTQSQLVKLLRNHSLLDIFGEANRLNKELNNRQVYFKAIHCLGFDAFFETESVLQDPILLEKCWIEKIKALLPQFEQKKQVELHFLGEWRTVLGFERVCFLFTLFHSLAPKIFCLKAIAAVDLFELSNGDENLLAEMLRKLKNAGLSGILDIGQKKTCGFFQSRKDFLFVHRTAHLQGLQSDALLIYQDQDSVEDQLEWLSDYRDLQNETQGFQSFLPVAYDYFQKGHVGTNRSAIKDLLVVAIARLYLNNFQHIKINTKIWGRELSQLSLVFGADEIEGYWDSFFAQTDFQQCLDQQISLENLISKARYIPIKKRERWNTLVFNRPPIETDSDPDASPYLTMASSSGLFEIIKNKVQDTQALDLNCHYAPAMFFSPRTIFCKEQLEQKIRHMWEHFGDAVDAYLYLDLVGYKKMESSGTLAGLFFAVEKLRQSLPRHRIVIAGLKSFWQLAQQDNVSLEEALAQLKKSGVLQIESSLKETESDLTHLEVASLHQTAHETGLWTFSKVTLSTPFQGKEPLWQPYIQRLLTIKELATNNKQMLGVSILPEKDCFVSAYEYLRAVAVASFVLDDSSYISTPLLSLPQLEPQFKNAVSLYHDREKLMTLAQLVGANDIGYVFNGLNSIEPQIQQWGLTPRLREPDYQISMIPNAQGFSQDAQGSYLL